MAYTYPFALADFWDKIVPLMGSIRPFKLESRINASGQGSGNQLIVETGPRFWTTQVNFRPLYKSEARLVEVLIESLDGGLNDFYAYDPLSIYPIFDPTGSKLAANPNGPIIDSTVGSDLKTIRFSGLPANFVINPGDMFSFSYGAGSAYQALHRIFVGATANGSGVTGFMEFRPALDDPSLPTGKTMRLIKPYCRMKIVPGSFDEGEHANIFRTGMTFTAEQVP
jgi:hypothetical protein